MADTGDGDDDVESDDGRTDAHFESNSIDGADAIVVVIDGGADI